VKAKDSIYRGTVSRVLAGDTYLSIPDLGLGQEFGPVQVMGPGVAVGEKVLVSTINGTPDDLAVMGSAACTR
jgi:hypothetical protein